MRRRPLPIAPWLVRLTWLAGALATPRAGAGQSTLRASADAGAAMIRQLGDTTVIAPTVGGEIDVRHERTAARATLVSTLAADGRWSAQGDLLLSHFAGPFGSPWEVGGLASSLRYTNETATQLTAYARRHLDRLAWGAWGGAGAGLTVRKYWRAPITAVEGGAWSRLGPLQLSLGAVTQRAHLDSSNAYEFPPGPVPAVPGGPSTGSTTPPPTPLVAARRVGFEIHTLYATDVTLLAAWRGPLVELSASAIVRHAPAQSAHLLGSALASVAWWAQPSLALTASAGTLAADPIRSAAAARYLTVGARWRPSPSSGTTRPRPPKVGVPDAGGMLPAEAIVARAAVHVVARDDGTRVLRIQAPGATRVEVRGDATAWRPVALVPRGQWWELELPGAEPGTQRLVARVDGGPWTVPGNLPTVEDDFGARVGLIVIP